MKASTTLSFLASLAAVSAADCPPPGQTNAAGDYSCNPAHEYPGQACALIGDCYYLRGLGVLTGSSTASSAQPTATCPPPGETNAAGDYSCNPAHEYPDKACALIDGCYFLRGLGVLTATSTSSSAQPTATCPPPGETNAAGDYSCNPAHEYPDKACALIDGCYYLRGLGYSVTSTAPNPHPTCPPPGQTNAIGDYSCNPAHRYPNQVCALIGGCYFLRGLGGNVTYTSVHPLSTKGPAVPTTIVISSNGVPVSTAVVSQPTHVITAGASQLSAAGGLVILGFIAALL
jgi:hypothetical protein